MEVEVCNRESLRHGGAAHSLKKMNRHTTRRRTATNQVFRRSRWALAAALLSAAQAWALPPDVKSNATRLLLQKQPMQALALLEPLEETHGQEFDFATLMGISSVDAGQADRGIIYLLRAQALRPQDTYVRAELARAYLASGEYASAQAALDGVASTDVPASAQPNLNRLRQNVQGALQQASLIGRNEAEAVRQAMERQLGPKPWSVQLSASVGHDNNVNLAPRLRQIPLTVPGLGVLTLPTQAPEKSGFTDVAAYGLYRATISDNWAWQTSGQVAHRSNASAHEFDNSVLALRSGPLLALSNTLALQAELEAQRQWVDGQPNLDTFALQLSARWRAAGQASGVQGGSIYLAPGKLDDVRTSFRDGKKETAGVSAYGRGLWGAPAAAWDAQAYALRERLLDPAAQDLSYSGGGLRMGLRQNISANTALGINLSLEKRDYKEATFLFAQRRSDLQKDLTLYAEIGLGNQLALVPSVQIGRNQSNVPIYDTKRVQGSIALRALY